MSIIIADGKSAERKLKKKQCLVVGCTNISRAGQKCSNGCKFCTKHDHEMRKKKNPHLYWYGVLRRNAKRRKKVFTITLEYFIQFCNETNYINLKGKKSGSMTIDRKIDELGYIDGNLQILEVGANSRKQYVDYWKHQEQGYEEPAIDVSDIIPLKSPESTDSIPF